MTLLNKYTQVFFLVCFLFGLSALLSPLSIHGSTTKTRLALVIGVDQYDGDPLRLPVRDAELISRQLEQVGFEVMLVKNPTKGKLIEARDRFVQKVKRAGDDVTALFFFAGHAVQFGGHNYMIPARAGLVTSVNRSGSSIPGRADYIDRAVDAQTGILNYLNDSGAKQVIFVLDACRTNPFNPARRGGATNDGLAPMDVHPGGADTFILFAAEPTQAAFDGEESALNSPFTLAFANAITQPGSSLEAVYRQVYDRVRAETNGVQRPYQEGVLFSFTFREAPKTTLANKKGWSSLDSGFTERDYDTAFDGTDLLKRFLKTRTIHEINMAANEGDAEAQYLLAIAYFSGISVEEDHEQYGYWLRRSAANGFSRAQYAMGIRLYRGLGHSKEDRKEGIEWWQLASENGNAAAMNALGDMYRIGDDMKEDLEKAESLYQNSIERGYVDSYEDLGLVYSKRAKSASYSGNRAQYNKLRQQELDYYLIGYENGCSPCAYQIGYMYRYGQYVSKDLQLAISWHKKSVEGGYQYAAEQLAYIYTTELATPQPRDAAIYWQKAIAMGSTLAKIELATLVKDNKISSISKAEAIQLFEEAAAEKSVRAATFLSELYMEGNLVRENHKKAEHFALLALTYYKELDEANEDAWPLYVANAAWNLIGLYKNKGLKPTDPDLASTLEASYGPGEKLKQFTLPFECGGISTDITIYAWDWGRSEPPTTTQLSWYKAARGCVPENEEVQEAFEKLYNIALEKDMSFIELIDLSMSMGNEEN